MNRHVVVREIDRADPEVVDALGQIGTASVHEAIGRVGYVGVQLRPILLAIAADPDPANLHRRGLEFDRAAKTTAGSR